MRGERSRIRTLQKMKMKKRNASKRRERGADGTVRLEWKEGRMRVKQRNIRADKTRLVLDDRSGILRSPISASAFFSSLSYPKLAEQKIPINTYIACIGSPSISPRARARARIKFIQY